MRFIYLLVVLFAFLNATQCEALENWALRPTDKEADHKFVIALHPNPEGVKKLEYLILHELSNIDSPNYGNYLSADEVNEMVAAPYAVRADMLNWLGPRSIKCADFSDNLVCTASLSDIDSVFQTKMVRYVRSDRFVHRSEAYTVPDDLKPHVAFIDGLSNRLPVHNTFKRNAKSHPIVDPGSISLEVMIRIYNLNSTLTGPGVSVGAMEYMDASYNDGFNNKSMLLDQAANGIPLNPIAPEHVVGKDNTPSDGESDLDVQVMYWAASDATLWYEAFDQWMYTWAVSFLNRKDKPEVVSLSWGWDEMDQCSITHCNGTTSKQYVTMSNVQFAKIVAQGVTIVVSAGDAGSPGRTNELCQSNKNGYYWNHINPVFPGGSPWVLSVGATYVVKSNQTFHYKTPICTNISGVTCAMGTVEQGTTYNLTGWTSGSGFVHWDPTPSWQQAEVKSYLTSGVELPNFRYFNAKGRAYPDIATFGHNCITKNSMGWQNADGTSCSSPIMAGGIANLNAFQKSRGKPTLGFVNPLLYKMGREMPSAFNDVTVGNSTCTEGTCCGPEYGFVAAKGWDPVSGLGTPNYGEMKRWLASQ